METAGKLVEDEELRDALKENGIGRPSTRANIIETLFKRNYIRKERKALFATLTGVQLIQTIQYDLLKSAELTGLWEKKLRQIESGNYEAKAFLEELKQMVNDIVMNVKFERGKSIAIENITAETEKKASKPQPQKAKQKKRTADEAKKAKSSTENSYQIPEICPLCGKGKIIKGKTAYGCSEWKSGCTFRRPFNQ